MCQAIQIQKILEILANNVKSNTSPNLVNSSQIANELCLTVQETNRVLETMNQMGVIQSNTDTGYCLITSSGMSRLDC